MIDVTVIDVSAATFEAEVLDASAQQPVVVDFWAPWCGPCRMLGPLLERLAESAGGAWRLAKVNVDENPSLAARFGVQGIPAVKTFRDGRPISEFVGAQPEAAVRRFIDGIVPSEADQQAMEGERRAAAGDLPGAEEAFRAVLQREPDHARALLDLGRVLAEGGRDEEALQALSALPPHSPEGREAAPLLAQLRLISTA